MVGLQTLDLAIGVRVPASQNSYGPDLLSGLDILFDQSGSSEEPLLSSILNYKVGKIVECG